MQGVTTLQRFAREEHERVTPERRSRTPHARLLAEADGAREDATYAEVRGLILTLLGPHSDYQEERRRGLVDALLCMLVPARPVYVDPVSVPEGRALAERLARMPPRLASVMRALMRRAGPPTS